MTPLPDAFEAQLVHLGLAREATAREALERDGWTPAGGDFRYGSEWWARPVRDEEASRG